MNPAQSTRPSCGPSKLMPSNVMLATLCSNKPDVGASQHRQDQILKRASGQKLGLGACRAHQERHCFLGHFAPPSVK